MDDFGGMLDEPLESMKVEGDEMGTEPKIPHKAEAQEALKSCAVLWYSGLSLRLWSSAKCCGK